MKKIVSFLWLISVFGATFSHAQGNLRYQDPNASFQLKEELFSLNRGIGFLGATTYLDVEQKQELRKFIDRYEALKLKYRSPAMDRMWIFSQDKISDGQRQAVVADQQLRNRFNGDYSEGYKFLHAYQCTYGRRGKSRSHYLDDVNENIRAVRKSLYILERRLPERTNSEAIMMTNEQAMAIDGPEILCKMFVDGGLVDQQPAVVVQEVKKTRVPPYSASGNPQHEMTCRILDDPRIPPPPPVRCVFNYK